MIYNGIEYTDQEILSLILEQEDCQIIINKADEGTWKERLSEKIASSVTLNLKHILTYKYVIIEGTQNICKCVGTSELSEVIN